MKLSDVVKDGVKDLEAQLREIRRNEEDDLGKLGEAFDSLATKADALSIRLYDAEKVLRGELVEDESKAETED